MEDLNTVGTEQTPMDSIGATDGGLDASDSGLDATPAGDQVATEQENTNNTVLDDIPDEYKSIIEAKLKNLESGYTKKYQAIAEEKREFEAQRREIEAQRQLLQQITSQQNSNPTTQQGYTDPLQGADWDYGVAADGRPLTQVMHEQYSTALGTMWQMLQEAMPTVQNLQQYVGEQTVSKQISDLKQQYGDFDEQELLSVKRNNPTVPLDFIAAKLLMPAKVEEAKQSAYKNVQQKRQANAAPASAAKTVQHANIGSIQDAYQAAINGIKL